MVLLRTKLPAAGIALVSVVAVYLLVSSTINAGPWNPCDKPGQVAVNCGFDTFDVQLWNGKTLLVPQAWSYFIQRGAPDFRQAEDTYWGGPSLALISDGMGWNAGLYQTVNVTPGQVYQADIGWSAPRCNFTLCYDMERRIGLDPTGGTDPQAGSVIWGRAEPGPDKWPDLTVAARASGPKMTVFLMVNHPSSHGQDEIYLDALGVWPDTSQPAVTNTPLPTYTPTRRPPTRTPVPAAAQATAVVAAEPTPAATALPSPTAVITPTNTATPFRTPTATPNVTIAPLNDVLGPVAQVAGGIEGGELVRVSRLQSVEQGRRAEVGPERWLLVVAAAAVVVAFAAGGIALVVWLRGAGRRAG